MTFFLHESIQPDGPGELLDHGLPDHSGSEFPIVRDKLRIPSTHGHIARPRLSSLLERSFEQFPATLISGRAGTGKTALAADIAEKSKDRCWYTVEGTDAEWPVFSRYFSASLVQAGLTEANGETPPYDASPTGIAKFLLRHFFQADSSTPKRQSSLIVLDDIHHIFDAPWFEEFFKLLLYSLPPKVHLLMLCRSKPPAPMWRLRSKQMLNVLDEKVIAFTADETSELFASLGLPASSAETAYRDSFGRVSKLLQHAENVSTNIPPST